MNKFLKSTIEYIEEKQKQKQTSEKFNTVNKDIAWFNFMVIKHVNHRM